MKLMLWYAAALGLYGYVWYHELILKL